MYSIFPIRKYAGLSYVVFHSTVIHGWVETEGEIVHTAREKTSTLTEISSFEFKKKN